MRSMGLTTFAVALAVLVVTTSAGLLWRTRVRRRRETPQERYRRSVPHLDSPAIAYFKKHGQVYEPVQRLMRRDWGPDG